MEIPRCAILSPSMYSIQRPAPRTSQNPGNFPGFGGMETPPNVGKFPTFLGAKIALCGVESPRPNSRFPNTLPFNPCLMLSTPAVLLAATCAATAATRAREELQPAEGAEADDGILCLYAVFNFRTFSIIVFVSKYQR